MKNLILLFLLTSCMPTIFSAATVAGITLAKDDDVDNTINDITISAKIRKEFLANPILVKNVTVKVDNRSVFLAGIVKTEQDILEAVDICWGIEGVESVINEIKVDDTRANKAELGQFAKDSIITAQIKTSTLLNRAIKMVNYTIITQDQIVYIFGIARTEFELKEIIRIASTTPGVIKVVSYIKIK